MRHARWSPCRRKRLTAVRVRRTPSGLCRDAPSSGQAEAVGLRAGRAIGRPVAPLLFTLFRQIDLRETGPVEERNRPIERDAHSRLRGSAERALVSVRSWESCRSTSSVERARRCLQSDDRHETGSSYVTTRMVAARRVSESGSMNASHVAPGPRFPHGITAVLLVTLVLSACSNGTTRWHPSFASQVPDGTPVRFGAGENGRRVTGLALDWERAPLRVVTSRGDTVVVPRGSALEVRLKEKASHPAIGAVIGWALGVAVSYATCPSPKRYCGEEDPSPLLGTGLGALVGSRVKTDWWVGVRWNTASPPH